MESVNRRMSTSTPRRSTLADSRRWAWPAVAAGIVARVGEARLPLNHTVRISEAPPEAKIALRKTESRAFAMFSHEKTSMFFELGTWP
jgi:hypothetical protein